jgi:isoquinoline 1-oxidoreductase beta subunit
MPGVRKAVKVNDTTVAVVADYVVARARRRSMQLPIVWNEGENATRTSAQIAEHLKEGLTAPNAYAMTTVGDHRRCDCRCAGESPKRSTAPRSSRTLAWSR